MRRVVVTGAGCITAIGQDVSAFAKNLFGGRSGISSLSDGHKGELHFGTVARVTDFTPKEWLTSSQTALADRSSQFAIASARQALAESRLMNAYAGEEIAVIFGCSTGGRNTEEPATAKLYTEGGRVHPLTVPRSMASAGTSLVCMEHGITGPAYTVSTACASGAHAIGQAFHMVRSGLVQAAVAGGHEAPLTRGFLKGWDSLHVVSPTCCKPFAADRDGVTIGEGAAMITIELMETAVQRGARILAEIVGFGMSSDAHHMTQADAAGPAAAMRRALADAEATVADVGYVNAHGTGTDVNDRVEADALHRVFGDSARDLLVSSTKGLHGHAMGASGAMELLATVLALQQGVLPGCGTVTVDQSLGLRGVLCESAPSNASFALSNSFAFGGLNAVIALRKYAQH